jgi:hypothetical protein
MLAAEICSVILSSGGDTILKKAGFASMVVFILSFILSPALFAEPNMHEGTWEIKVK